MIVQITSHRYDNRYCFRYVFGERTYLNEECKGSYYFGDDSVALILETI